ncbi:MAG: LamG domain-containing protein [Kiritimatiellales bacterium]|nr:LamG domain-containing protein [Kiritimatiellales bacterium]
MKKRRSMLTIAILAGLVAATSTPAALIAHYDFSDGDLFDNEVGSSYKLAQKTRGTGKAQVTLNAENGSAVFPGGRSITKAIAWLETKGPGNVNSFTVSFWFRTTKVDQDEPFMGLFSSNTDFKTGDWQLHSDGSKGGDACDNGQLCFISGKSKKSNMDAPLHQPNVWYHVVIRKDAANALKPTKIYLTAVGQPLGKPICHSMERKLRLAKFMLGANRVKDMSYAMEVANVKIFDDAKVSIADLLKEGPGGGGK